MDISAILGLELKNMLDHKESIEKISEWAYLAYLDNKLDSSLSQLMLDLTVMEEGPEYVLSYDILYKVSGDLIVGKNVDLDSENYKVNL